MTTTSDTLAGFEQACAARTPVTIAGRRFRVAGTGTCPPGDCSTGPVCPGLVYLHTDDTGPAALALPAVHVRAGEEYRLEIVTDPDPDVPAVIVWYRADGIAAAIAKARRWLAARPDDHGGPGEQYGELYQREDGDLGVHLTTIHLGA